MGNLGYNQSNPPPFHFNVNSSPYNGNNNLNYLYYVNQNQKPETINNTSNSGNTSPQKPEINTTNNNPNTQFNDKKKNKKKKEIKRYEDEIDFSIDIDVIDKNRVNVKIPVNKKKLWQKEYNNNELIETVINDYIKENKLNLPNDFFDELRCFNYKVSMKDQISTLIPIDDESKDIYQGNDLSSKNIDLSHLNEKYTEIVGKPFCDPFEIFCFYKSQRKFRILHYNNDLIQKTNINKFNKTSAFCNGWNHLYISGGEGCENLFWDINLKKNLIHDPIQIPPKKYHSMIYIPKSIVFIVGGDNSDTYYYNLKLKKIVNWGKLNMIRIEPALQIIKNKLYCIDSIKNLNTISYEMTDLTSNEGRWKIIMPKISYNISNLNYYQQFFGICKDKEDNIIFLGGKFSNNNINNDKNSMNFMLNTLNNTLGVSKVKFKSFNLKEKCFCPFNKLYDFVLTDFPRESPQMAFYNKKKGKVELINFSPDDISKKSGVSSGINPQNQLNNNTSNISPSYINNNLNNQNVNNTDLQNGIFVSFRPQEKSLTNANIPVLNNQNNKIVNNITPIIDHKYNNTNLNNLNNLTNINNNNQITNLAYQNNYVRKNTPQFMNTTTTNINTNLYQPNQNYLLNRNTVGVYSRTPDKNIYNYQNLVTPNNILNTYYTTYRDSSHSADATRKRFYYPRSGIGSESHGLKYY